MFKCAKNTVAIRDEVAKLFRLGELTETKVIIEHRNIKREETVMCA